MVNIFLELERLKATLAARGYSSEDINNIVKRAEEEINQKLREQLEQALENAVQSGVQKDSYEFINELRPSFDAFMIETESSRLDFSTPPIHMLDRLLARSTKPMADGSGVYRVIPIGGDGDKKNKPPIHANIFDAQKAMMAERYENSVKQYSRVLPKNSRAVHFRTATSKQDRNTQWVLPPKEKNFAEDLSIINMMLKESRDNIILDVIQSYEEGY